MAELTGRALIASRCAKFFKDGDFVNLGIGVPLMCVNYLPEGVDLWLEAEIGTVGSGPSPKWSDADIDIIDAGGMPASVIKGGSVGIAGKQTGIYPIDSPGGWQLIGRTPLRLFTPEASRPTLIEAGYEVRFVPVTEEEYKKIEAEVAAGTYKPVITEAK